MCVSNSRGSDIRRFLRSPASLLTFITHVLLVFVRTSCFPALHPLIQPLAANFMPFPHSTFQLFRPVPWFHEIELECLQNVDRWRATRMEMRRNEQWQADLWLNYATVWSISALICTSFISSPNIGRISRYAPMSGICINALIALNSNETSDILKLLEYGKSSWNLDENKGKKSKGV